MSETDLQLGGGYTYRWECAILLALNYFFEPVRDEPLTMPRAPSTLSLRKMAALVLLRNPELGLSNIPSPALRTGGSSAGARGVKSPW
jgi:hypothetical protein